MAFACRLRLSFDGEPPPAGRLLPLAGPDLADPILDPALRLMQLRAWTPPAAVAKLSRDVEPALLSCLQHGGHITPIQLRGKRFNGSQAWPMPDRSRVDEVRASLLGALFDLRCPTPTTAAIVSLLYAVDGFTAVLSLNERGRRWVDSRAGDIAGGCWLDESPFDQPTCDEANRGGATSQSCDVGIGGAAGTNLAPAPGR